MLVVLLAVTLATWTDAHNSLCSAGMLNSSQCLTAVRQLMTDENRFWFGDGFASACPPGNYTRECNNFDRAHKSIATRMLNNSNVNTSVSGIQQVLNVTFQTPAGAYESCGNDYQVPPITFTVDPTHIGHIPLWAVNYQLPLVNWGSEVNKTYALIVWDAGAHVLHALFFNIKGGNLERSTTAWNYRGPKNPVERDQPYTFLLYEQTGSADLDPADVQKKLIDILTPSRNLAPQVIVTALALEGPVGVSILTVKTDPFVAAFMKQNRIVNNCPAILTPMFRSLPLAYNVSGDQLMTSVDVTFRSPEVSVSACCKNDTVGMRVTNPLVNDLIAPVYTRLQPQVTLVPANFVDSFYFLRFYLTLLVIEDLAGASNPETHLLWQVVNIREGDVTSGTTIQPYQAPIPLAGMPERTVIFLLLKQEAPVQNVSALTKYTGADSCPQSYLKNRCRFDTNTFIRDHRMTVEGASWFRTAPDLFSRRQAVTLNIQTEADACKGVSGFASPCATTTCTSASTAIPGSVWVLGIGAVFSLLFRE